MGIRTILIVRSLLMLILFLSIIGLVVWLICFLLGVCGWTWGIISVSAMLLSPLLYPRIYAGPSENNILKYIKDVLSDIFFYKICTYVPSTRNEGMIHALSSIFAPAEV